MQKEHGILPAFPSARGTGKPLSDDVVRAVKQFYCEDDVSCLRPGAQDIVSVRGDRRVHKQEATQTVVAES